MKKVLAAVIVMAIMFAGVAFADTAAELDARVQRTIKLFEQTRGASDVLAKAKGVLVFPRIIKAGVIFGGEYGEGSLLIDGETAGYYNTVAGSFGFQLGGKKTSLIMAFMDQAALDRFRNASGWEVGADASVALITVGADGSIDTTKTNQPIIAFVFDQKGLMGGVTIEGAKITKINKY